MGEDGLTWLERAPRIKMLPDTKTGTLPVELGGAAETASSHDAGRALLHEAPGTGHVKPVWRKRRRIARAVLQNLRDPLHFRDEEPV